MTDYASLHTGSLAATTTLFGACPTNPGGTTEAAAQTVVTKFGGTPAIRQFMGAALDWPAVPVGCLMHRSYKPATTVTDSEIDTLLTAAAGHYVTFWHESDIDDLDATARAARIALLNRLYDRNVALGNPATVVPTFSGELFASYTTQAARDLWTDVKGDLLGIDCTGVYDVDNQPPMQTTYADEIANVLTWVSNHAAKGFTGWTVPALAISRPSYDTRGTYRRQWMEDQTALMVNDGAKAVMWFDYELSARSDVLVPGSAEFHYWESQIARNGSSGGSGIMEVAGGGYARQIVVWGAPVDGLYTSDPITWSAPAGTELTNVGLWHDAVFGGYTLISDTVGGGGTYTTTITKVEGAPAEAGGGDVPVTEPGTEDETVVMAVQILDQVLDRAPTALIVAVTEAIPYIEVDFYIDGVLVFTTEANSDGNIPPASVLVDEVLGTQGTHTLTVKQPGSTDASDTFTLRRPPVADPDVMGTDAQPVAIPGAVTASGVRRWVFHDVMPEADGGIGYWIMPMNPGEMTNPFLERNYSTRHTTALSGKYHIFEGGTSPKEWTFSGYCPTQEMADKMLEFRNLNRRFYITDHRNRAWKVIAIDLELRPRLAQIWQETKDSPSDWNLVGQDYTFTVLGLEQTWAVPA